MKDTLNVLLIDDDEEDYLIVADMIAEVRGSKWKVDWCSTYEQGLAAICREEHDICLLDYYLGARDGLDILREAGARDCRMPIILLTAHGNIDVDISAMLAGAADYLVKNEFTPLVLERAIRYAIERKQIEDELRRHKQDLEKLVAKRTLQHAEARAEAEKRATEAERRQAILDALLEHVPEGIAIIELPNMKVQALSRYALDLVDSSREKFEKSLLDENPSVSGAGTGAHSPLPVADAVLQGKSISNEEYLLRKDSNGDQVPVLVSAGPIRDGLGNVTGAIAAWRDISELKRIQKELQEARDELEMRVYQRTLELAKTMLDLRDSQEELRSLATRLLHAQEDERKRIAREMHDSIGSSLSAVKFCLENAAKKAEEGSADPKAFGMLAKAMEHAIDESRRIMTDLRPSILDDLGILATINWFCRRYETIYSGISVEKEVRIREDQVPEHLKIILFRIMQEAMNNAAKYSKAGKINVVLALECGCLELRIQDDGVGFEPGDVVARGDTGRLGLTSMRERAELSGGRFELRSTLGAGTKIMACWELEADLNLINSK
jgi:signal transduction histidine kinase/DNA-binding response OmpR family regulator